MGTTGAVVVAAGMSSRMHDFKPMLPFGKSTIALHNISMLKKMSLDPIVVVTGYRSEELQAHLSSTGVRFVKNERFADTQMFDSVKLGINEILNESEKILIMPMDMPAIEMSTFQAVMKVNAPIVRTRFDGKAGHPVILRKDVAKQFLEYNGENGLKGAIRASGIEPCDISVLDEGVHKDIDTPQDYQNLIEWNYARGNGYPIRPSVEVGLLANKAFFGADTAKLLELIRETGSRQAACDEMNISYSKARKLISTAEQQLGFPLIRRWCGGATGGGSALTEDCEQLLERYRKMVAQVQMAAEKAYRDYMEY